MTYDFIMRREAKEKGKKIGEAVQAPQLLRDELEYLGLPLILECKDCKHPLFNGVNLVHADLRCIEQCGKGTTCNYSMEINLRKERGPWIVDENGNLKQAKIICKTCKTQYITSTCYSFLNISCRKCKAAGEMENYRLAMDGEINENEHEETIPIPPGAIGITKAKRD